ncbi:hypothetical protein MRX96_058615 [Rhipicephalus microplus]
MLGIDLQIVHSCNPLGKRPEWLHLAGGCVADRLFYYWPRARAVLATPLHATAAKRVTGTPESLSFSPRAPPRHKRRRTTLPLLGFPTPTGIACRASTNALRATTSRQQRGVGPERAAARPSHVPQGPPRRGLNEKQRAVPQGWVFGACAAAARGTRDLFTERKNKR